MFLEKLFLKFMARIFVGKIYCNDRVKILIEFFICLISYSDLFFGKIICKLYHNNSVKIYVDISLTTPLPLVEKRRVFGNPPPPLSVYVENGWPLNCFSLLWQFFYENKVLQKKCVKNKYAFSHSSWFPEIYKSDLL